MTASHAIFLCSRAPDEKQPVLNMIKHLFNVFKSEGKIEMLKR
ncbi:Uncharacterized protein APZ42_016738 [Daphnia magna]|uniref:Uncharacterized protein n=1 Tax=Daphnia magna TaxID=35525 RepID=A0A165A429_9CRUS|nr:Uncharacterized protein APZ42_016738 [Daphnia magna]